ncbi:PREDICTED: uncharacterized protein LOC108357702, partial [Rhagoletis zephyria]|uniref:uncharacterized protein LOC108357702 n=1 Tax=Rhagoletis zephyria TaxID=28612 RepID=UPI0008118F9C
PLYVCGEKVVGTAELTLLKERSFEDIRIGFRGMATVRWVDTLTRFPKLYSAEETYMEIETVVFQGGQLLPSTYKYEFDFRVPDVCPTTCTTDIGKIYYELSLLLVYDDKEKRKFTSEVMVLQTYNIEKLPNALSSRAAVVVDIALVVVAVVATVVVLVDAAITSFGIGSTLSIL